MENFREGEFVETSEGLIFHVKGVHHPSDAVIAFLRYVPSNSGNREKDGKTYRKIYPVEERFEYLEKNFPKYVHYSDRVQKKIQKVSLEDIEKVFKPEKKLKELRKKSDLSGIEKDVVKFVNKLIKSGIEPENLGITGSVLVGLQRDKSDIDLIGYGKKQSRKIYSALKDLKKQNSHIKSYDEKNASKIAKFRWGKTELPIKIFTDLERKKVLHGMFKNRDFFMRLVKNYQEIEGDYKDFSFFPKGKAKIKATIENDKDSIFTPNHYQLKNIEAENEKITNVKKATSYRGRFTEQAKEKEKIIALGRLEKVEQKNNTYNRLLLGQPDEYLLPLNDSVKKELQIF